MGTKLDRSQASGVLITCTDCPFWFAFAWTVAKGHDSAADHEERVHPGRTAASKRRHEFLEYQARHAV